MELKKEIAKYWVGGEDRPPRQSQIKQLNSLVDNKHYKYIFLEAPVGSGKSLVGLTFSRYMGNYSYALTPQVILQRQYEDDFGDDKSLKLASLYGKANYTCEEKGGISCAIGSIVKPRCKSCPYNIARDAASKANNTVMNYTMALSAWKYTKIFKDDSDTLVQRKLVICDEGHSLDQNLVSFDAIQVTDKWCVDHALQMPAKKTRNVTVMVDFIRS